MTGLCCVLQLRWYRTMTHPKPQKWTVDRILKWSAAVACVSGIVSVGYATRTVYRDRVLAETSPGGYQAGEEFNHPELVSDKTPFTLVIWIDPRCGAYQVSTDFYRKLATQEPPNVRLTVAAPEPRSRLDAFLLEHTIPIKSVYAIDGDAKVRRLGPVPALVLVDRDGIVRNRWIGRLNSPQESEVLEVLASSGR